MAKKGGKSKGATSAGVHSNVKSSIINSIRRDYLASGERLMNQLNAFRQRKNVMLTIENPDKNDRSKPFIRVPATQVWKNA
jgi:hypothetical protein